MHHFRALLHRVFGQIRHHVGTDQFGNKYYFVPEQKTWTGQTIRSRRMIETVNPKEIEYELGNIPLEWEDQPAILLIVFLILLTGCRMDDNSASGALSWIRGSRKDPPTIEEILKNEKYRTIIKSRAYEIQQDDAIRKEKEYKEDLVARPVQTQIKGHASAHYFGKDKISSEPSSTANTFQPGSWLPSENTSKKK